MEDNKKHIEEKVTIKAWISLFILLIMFSGIFRNSTGPLQAFDFSVLTGKFGNIGELGNFVGKGGVGARHGFLYALSLTPTIVLAVGLIEVVEQMGAMAAARKLFQPILKPLYGIPGITGISYVASFTSSDIAAFMTKELVEAGEITDKERTIYVSYQYAGSAVILNTIGTQAPLLPIIVLPVGAMIAVLWICKTVGANLMRLYLKYESKKSNQLAKEV